ncbi:MAG: hypothetical protein R3C11_04730 [Planctomycetaceae bacterium]
MKIHTEQVSHEQQTKVDDRKVDFISTQAMPSSRQSRFPPPDYGSGSGKKFDLTLSLL